MEPVKAPAQGRPLVEKDIILALTEPPPLKGAHPVNKNGGGKMKKEYGELTGWLVEMGCTSGPLERYILGSRWINRHVPFVARETRVSVIERAYNMGIAKPWKPWWQEWLLYGD